MSAPDDIDQALTRLQVKANQLRVVDSGLVGRTNAALAKLGGGLEAWAPAEIAPGVQVGYAKVDGEWQLALRTAEGDVPLITAGLVWRAAAAGHLMDVLVEMERKLDGILNASSRSTTEGTPA